MDERDIYDNVDGFVWALSSFGNAYFSGLSYHQLWEAVKLSSNPIELDAAINASEFLNEIVYYKNKK